MIRNIILLLIASSAVAKTMSTQRGHLRASSSNGIKRNNKKQNRKIELRGQPKTMTRPCTMILREMQYQDHHDEHAWECELDADDNDGVSGKIVEINVDFALDQRDHNTGVFKSGVTTLDASDTTIIEEKVIIKGSPKFHKKESSEHDVRRLSTIGTKSVLVIRVEAADSSTTSSEEVLAREIFGITDSSGETDSLNLVSGFAQCSRNKLQFEPVEDNRIKNGVYTVKIPNTVKGSKHRVIREAVTKQATSELGNLGSQFDHVMLCLPPGTGNWIAYAYINNWRSVYNDEWCTKPSAQMHEIGHNLGLGHSTEGGEKYADQTGLMGYSYFEDEGPAMCFNNAKNWQLGFYQEKQATVKPLEDSWTGKLIGFVDYESAGSDDKTVVLKVEGHNKNYYIGFNHKAGDNRDNKEPDAANRVTIQSRDTKDGFGESVLEAKLGVGKSFTIAEFGGQSRDVLIQVTNIDLSASPPVAEVSVELLKCLSNDDCSDGSSCTDDICNISTGTCLNLPNDTCPGIMKMTFLTDNYPGDVSWDIVDNCNNNKVVMSGGNYNDVSETYDHEENLAPSEYTLKVNDTYGDGICCGSGHGSYTVTFNNEVVAIGGKYGNEDIKTWGSCETEVPSPAPTKSPTTSPTKSPTMSPTSSSTTCDLRYELTIHTDGNGGEISWEIAHDLQRSVVAASSYSTNYMSDTKYVETGCLDSDCYRFAMIDSWGDGLCCSYGSGSYSLKINGNEIASGGEFMSKEETIFGTCKSEQFQKEMVAQATSEKDQKD